jgi:hypothetical protein
LRLTHFLEDDAIFSKLYVFFVVFLAILETDYLYLLRWFLFEVMGGKISL